MHILHHESNSSCCHKKHNEEGYGSNAMYTWIASSINSSNSTIESKNWDECPFLQPLVGAFRVVNLLLLNLQKLEGCVVDQDNKTSSWQHQCSEHNILRIVASCICDGCMRKGFLILVLYCHVVAIQAGKDQERDEEVEEVVNVESSQ